MHTRRNRNRVLKLSSSYRNPMVKHEPELHNAQWLPQWLSEHADLGRGCWLSAKRML